MPDNTPASNLPPAARKAAKEANRLVAELNKPAVPATPTAAAAPVVAPAPAAAPPPAEDPVKAAEHKFSVLQGKYNAEVPTLRGQVQALMQENARLAAASAAPPAPRAEERFDTTAVTAKEREEYGEELVNLMARIAKANSAAEVTALKEEIARMKGSVQQTVQIGAQTRMEKVWQALDNTVPTWRVLNDSSQFLDWLKETDIMSGMPRHAGLTQAFETGDSARVVGIFKRFVEEDSLARSTSQDPPPPAAQVNRETLVAPAPGRGSGGEAPNGVNGRIYSEQEIDEFYSRVQRKRISEEEKKATEADIQLAVREGRVVPRRDDRHLANSR